MNLLKSSSNIMEHPSLYRLWQAPFARAKIAPVLRHNDLQQVRRVLDVGCGPGTNCPFFEHTDYLGMDINPSYIEYASQKFGREFVVQDVCQYEPGETRFDFILLNSLLHHIDDAAAARLLNHLRTTLDTDGHVHIIELVLGERPSIARFMAKSDRGDYPRSLEHWQTLFGASFSEVVFEPFPVRCVGVPLWDLVYFKGTART